MHYLSLQTLPPLVFWALKVVSNSVDFQTLYLQVVKSFVCSGSKSPSNLQEFMGKALIE